METLDRDVRLSRRQLSQKLRELGFRVSESTLSTKATRGGGPPFRKFGPHVVYDWGSALDCGGATDAPALQHI